MIDKILFNLLTLDGNETSLLNNKDTYLLFKELIIEVTKAKYEIRYCRTKNCKCHPEYVIKQLLEDYSLLQFLQVHGYEGIISDLRKITTDYIPTIAKGIYEED